MMMPVRNTSLVGTLLVSACCLMSSGRSFSFVVHHPAAASTSAARSRRGGATLARRPSVSRSVAGGKLRTRWHHGVGMTAITPAAAAGHAEGGGEIFEKSKSICSQTKLKVLTFETLGASLFVAESCLSRLTLAAAARTSSPLPRRQGLRSISPSLIVCCRCPGCCLSWSLVRTGPAVHTAFSGFSKQQSRTCLSCILLHTKCWLVARQSDVVAGGYVAAVRFSVGGDDSREKFERVALQLSPKYILGVRFFSV